MYSDGLQCARQDWQVHPTSVINRRAGCLTISPEPLRRYTVFDPHAGHGAEIVFTEPGSRRASMFNCQPLQAATICKMP
jgi:hypothetical protein